jgi:hypothetical protein
MTQPIAQHHIDGQSQQYQHSIETLHPSQYAERKKCSFHWFTITEWYIGPALQGGYKEMQFEGAATRGAHSPVEIGAHHSSMSLAFSSSGMSGLISMGW